MLHVLCGNRGPALLLMLGFAMTAACSSRAKAPGALMLAIHTDMAAPKDVTEVGLYITSAGRPIFDDTRQVAPNGEVSFPSTLAVIAGDPKATVKVKLVAFQKGKARVLREAITTVPQDRTALLRLPIQWLSDGSGKGDASADGLLSHAQITSICPEGQTSIAGICTDATIDSSTLPTYAEADVYGGGSQGGEGTCFDVRTCFASTSPMAVDVPTCSVGKPSGNFNLALRTAADGECGIGNQPGCLVPLDGPGAIGGWNENAGRIALPPGVCARLADGRASAVVVGVGCGVKEAKSPLCGEASSVKGSRVEVDGGAVLPPPTTTTTAKFEDIGLSEDHPTYLTLDNTSLYFVARGGKVLAYDKSNTKQPSNVKPGDGSQALNYRIATNGDYVGVIGPTSGNGKLEVLPVRPGPFPLNVPDIVGGSAMALTVTDVFWVASGALFSCGLANCVTPVQQSPNTPFSHIVWDGASSRLVGALPGGVIATCLPPCVGAPQTLGTVAGEIIGGLAVTGGDVVYATVGPTGSIGKIPKSGGTPVVLASGEILTEPPQEQGVPHAVAADATHVFWTTNSNAVRGVSLAGGTPFDVATGQNGVRGVAVDQTHVYWAATYDGRVRRVLKSEVVR